MPSAAAGARRLPLLLLAAVLVVLGSALLGSTAAWGEVASFDLDSPFWRIRAPRAALAALAGAGLAIGGVIFQALFRNPLAEPYTLGIASGASLGAAIGFLTGLSGRVASLLALAGAAAALGVVYLMARLRGAADMTRLLLAGVCVAYASAAGILLVSFLADQTVTREIVVWLMGSLGIHRPMAAVEVGVILFFVLLLACYWHRAYDLLWMGEALAATRGVAVGPVIWGSFAGVGLLTAVIVAHCGPIGFVGLMVPHMARALVGPRTLPLLIGATAVGAAFLALADGLSRALPSWFYEGIVGFELPVGIVTNLLGAGFFFYLLTRRAQH